MCMSKRNCKECYFGCLDDCLFYDNAPRYASNEDLKLANDAILKWCKENPAKTYKEDFLEKFPNAKLKEVMDDKVPIVCRNEVYKNCSYYKTKNKSPLEHTLIFTGDCIECWNESIEEEE